MSKTTLAIKKLVLIAVLGASLNAVKFLLMYIPNVEAVTFLVTVYTYCFGLSVGLPATLLFCTLEGCIFGFDPSWLIAYFIHFPFVSVVSYCCKLLKIKKPLIIALIIGFVTALFGFQSTFIYFLLGGAVGKPGWAERYFITYSSGAFFYIAEIVTNLILITAAFKPATKLLNRLGDGYFGRKNSL